MRKIDKMKQFLTLFIVLGCVFSSKAQTAEDSVKAAVTVLFKGMVTADAGLLRSAFTDSAILQTIVTSKDGLTSVRNEDVKDFADFVSKQKKGAADERIEFETIKIDGALASVWTPYKFYFDGKFRHCGVNSFQLVRINGIWKIQYLIDTRRLTGCE